MNLEELTLSQPILSLQYMLRILSGKWAALPQLIPDGVFGEQTLEAVMIFQREFQLPVTGVVDAETWRAIREEWLRLEEEQPPVRMFQGFPGEGHRAVPGDRGEYLRLVQAMFQSLRGVFPELEEQAVDGVYRGASVRNVRWLQRRGGIPDNGVLDSRTWGLLTALYELFVVRGAPIRGLKPGRG